MSGPINDNGNLESAFGFHCQALPSFQHGISEGLGLTNAADGLSVTGASAGQGCVV